MGAIGLDHCEHLDTLAAISQEKGGDQTDDGDQRQTASEVHGVLEGICLERSAHLLGGSAARSWQLGLPGAVRRNNRRGLGALRTRQAWMGPAEGCDRSWLCRNQLGRKAADSAMAGLPLRLDGANPPAAEQLALEQYWPAQDKE